MHSFELRPNASLTPRAAAWFYGWLCALSLTIALGFAAQGFWPVLPFAGLELGLLYWAVARVSRRAEAREFIRVDERTVTVEKWSPPGLHGGQDPGGRMAWSFQRAWTRVELQAGSPAHWPTRLVVRSSGQRVEVGAFLTDGERQGLWSRLAGLLNETGTAAGAGTARRAGLDSL